MLRSKFKLLILVLFLSVVFTYGFSVYSNEKNTMVSYDVKNQETLNYKENEILIKLNDETFEDYLVEKYDVKINLVFSSYRKVIFSNYEMEELLAILNKYSEIDYAEPNYSYELNSYLSEPLYSEQWAFTNVSYGINIQQLWSITYGKPNVVVGVVDSGIDYLHPDLEANIWVNTSETPNNGVDDDGNGFIDDYYGWDFGENNNDPMDVAVHGTLVAGVIAADLNGEGLMGVAPDIKVMALKTDDADGVIYLDKIVEATLYGISKGVKIFNYSFGSEHNSNLFRDMLQNSDAVFITAAGNGSGEPATGYNIDHQPVYPASYNFPNIITVAAIRSNGELAAFSNYSANSVHLAAPGQEIITTGPSDYGLYLTADGTSFAAPYVTGVVALLHGLYPEAEFSVIKQALIASAKPLSSLSGKTVSGGTLDAYGAYLHLKDLMEQTVLLGDVNGDGAVTISDLVLLRRHLAGLETIQPQYLINADTNQDGSVTISDIVKLRRYLAGLENLWKKYF